MTYDLAALWTDRTNPDQFAQWEYGIVTAISGFTQVSVNLAGLVVTMPTVYPATVGDTAVVLRMGARRVALGCTNQPTPTSGTVTTVGATTVTVTVNGVTGIVLRRHSGYAPTVNDVVHIVNGAALDKWASTPPAPTPPPAPPAPPSAPASGSTPFATRDMATFRNGSWRTDSAAAYQGDGPGISGMNYGAWFYHGAPNNALAGATVTSAAIFLHRTYAGVYGAQTINLYLHSSPTRPAGDVTRTSGPIGCSLPVEGSGWFSHATLTSWAQSLVSGTAGGFGITGNPYLRLAPLSEDPGMGTLQIAWTR